jgi:hypothetical protein
MSLIAAALALFFMISNGQEFEQRKTTLVQQLAVWEPNPSDISSHPVSFLMSKLKEELGGADKTLPAVGILGSNMKIGTQLVSATLVNSLNEPVNEVTDEYANVLEDYHIMR